MTSDAAARDILPSVAPVASTDPAVRQLKAARCRLILKALQHHARCSSNEKEISTRGCRGKLTEVFLQGARWLHRLVRCLRVQSRRAASFIFADGKFR